MSDESAVAEADAAVEALHAPSEPAGQYDMADPDDDGPPQIEHAPPRVEPRAAKEPKTPKDTGKPAGPKSVSKPGRTHRNGKAALNLPAASKPLEIADPDDHAPAAEAPEPETTRDEAPEAAKPELPEISADLMRQAEAHGFTQEDAEDLGPDALLRAITASDRRELAALKAQAQREQPTEQRQPEQRTEQRREPQREPAPAPQRTPAPEPAAKTTSGFEKLKIDLDPKDYDEGTISVINKLTAAHNSQLDQIEGLMKTVEELRSKVDPLGQQFEHVTGRFQAEDHARFTTDMDNFFDGLGDDFRDTFGKGPIHGMNPADATHKSREAFVNQMSELRMLDQIKGRQTSIDDLRQRAMRLLHSDKLEKQTRGKLVKAVEQRRSQSVARPTSRQSAPRTPDDAAVRFATTFLKDHGADGEAEAPDEI